MKTFQFHGACNFVVVLVDLEKEDEEIERKKKQKLLF
jgi:hypothetical protein